MEYSLIRSAIKHLGGNYSLPIITSLVHLEDKIFSANLCYRRIRSSQNNLRRCLARLLNPNPLQNALARKRHSYEHFFFVCCSNVSDEMRSMRDSGFYVNEMEVLIQRLKPLCDRRDAYEHGSDDLHRLYSKQLTRSQSRYHLDRKIPKAGDYNFKKNMELLNEIYFEILILLGFRVK